jgi:hypothetical protein
VRLHSAGSHIGCAPNVNDRILAAPSDHLAHAFLRVEVTDPPAAISCDFLELVHRREKPFRRAHRDTCGDANGAIVDVARYRVAAPGEQMRDSRIEDLVRDRIPPVTPQQLEDELARRSVTVIHPAVWKAKVIRLKTIDSQKPTREHSPRSSSGRTLADRARVAGPRPRWSEDKNQPMNRTVASFPSSSRRATG